MRYFICLLTLPLLLFSCSAAKTEPAAEELIAVIEPDPVLAHVKSIRGANIQSPKSAIFSRDGSRFFVNSLEGMKTVIFDAATLKELGTIPHSFSEEDAKLFQNEDRLPGYEYFTQPPNGQTKCFRGKPVEFAITHNGKYLWVTYYRKNWDSKATSPSAVTIIDTDTNQPVRVMPAGTIPKMLAASPDGNTMAVINWGDNTIDLIDISSDDPKQFKHIRQLVDGKKLDLAHTGGDRDSNCGYCLRGAVFSPDSRYLLTGRMHGGDISVFDTQSGERVGVLTGFPATPRHLARDGSKLYVSSNSSGYVSEIDLDAALAALLASPAKSFQVTPRKLFVGKGARTISLSPDGRYIFAVSNRDSKISMIDKNKWKIIAQLPVSEYGVGLAISPDGKKLITTSQGRQGKGGHVLDVYELN